MNILSVENISKSFGERTLFSELTFGIAAGEKVALIAKNGTGKTSLLKMLNREESPDTGQITFRKNIVVGYLEQDPHFQDAKTPYEVVFSSDNPTIKAVREYEEALANPENADELDRTLQEMDRLNAWAAESRIKQILTQLQLVDFSADVNTLSGGQRKRLALAKILIDDPDLLILDEPTNHLDLEMIEWLEEYLKGSQRSVLMVTHDRYFLENICTTLLEIDEGKLFKYEGSYSHYLTVKTERQEVEKVNLAKTKKVFKKELEWMRSTPQARPT
jgi:ATP-binding cassette subfamily F protein uup